MGDKLFTPWQKGDKVPFKRHGRWEVYEAYEFTDHGTTLFRRVGLFPKTNIDPTAWDICIGQ